MRCFSRFAVAVLLAFAVAGCGKKGPDVYHVSGTADFAGKPIPAGRVYFNPDLTKGNDGPQGYADIRDGNFDTRNKGRGTMGGAVVVRIEGFASVGDNASSYGKPLFVAHEVREDLPREDCSRIWAVPASAAKGLPKYTGSNP